MQVEDTLCAEGPHTGTVWLSAKLAGLPAGDLQWRDGRGQRVWAEGRPDSGGNFGLLLWGRDEELSLWHQGPRGLARPVLRCSLR
jgi:hypothetical protein